MNDANTALQAKVLFYGDDFTGASDNAAQYARHGLKTVLFFSDPGMDFLEQSARNYDVLGVAGTARSLDPDGMRAELVPVLEKFRQLDIPLVQYKCCSTFDSSPDTGSLGHAMQLMQACWPGSLIPVLAATPEFGRYTIFGHHYARAGTTVHRLDRHPVMSRHPVTPMHESDLSLVLAQQGFNPGHAVDLRLLDHFEATPDVLANELMAHDSVVFDGYTLKQVMTAAASLWHVSQRRQVCAMAAQGFAHGLGTWLRLSGRLTSSPPAHKLAAVDRLLVLSGSCSSLSADQIAWARRAGFLTMRAERSLLTCEDPGALDSLEKRMLDALKSGTSVIVFTAEGPDDAQLSTASTQPLNALAVAQRIGHLFARLARVAFERVGLQRLVVAGGDSSSFTMRDILASALEIKASHFGQNAHVCTLLSDDPLINNKEVLLKGGQVGQADLYGLMLNGFSDSSA